MVGRLFPSTSTMFRTRKARGPHSSTEPKLTPPDYDIVHQSATTLVPEVYHPQLWQDAAEQAARAQVKVGSHDVDTVNDTGLPDRNLDEFAALQDAALKQSEVALKSLHHDMEAESAARTEIAQAEVAELEGERDRCQNQLNEVEERLLEKVGREGLAKARTQKGWNAWPRWAVLGLFIAAELAFDYNGLTALKAESFITFLIAVLLVGGALLPAHEAGKMHALDRHGKAVALDVVTVVFGFAAALLLAVTRTMLLNSNAGPMESIARALGNGAAATSDSGSALDIVAPITLFTLSFLLPIIVVVLTAVTYEPLVNEALSLRGLLNALDKRIPTAREQAVLMRERHEALRGKPDHYEEEIAAKRDALAAAVAEMARTYDRTLLEEIGSPDATSSIADVYHQREPGKLNPGTLRAV